MALSNGDSTIYIVLDTALMLLVEGQEEHPAYKKLSDEVL